MQPLHSSPHNSHFSYSNSLHWPHNNPNSPRNHTHLDEPNTALGGRLRPCFDIKHTAHNAYSDHDDIRACGGQSHIEPVTNTHSSPNSASTSPQLNIGSSGADPTTKETSTQAKVNMCIAYARNSGDSSQDQSSELSPSLPHTFRYQHQRRSSLPPHMLELSVHNASSNPSMCIRSYTDSQKPTNKRVMRERRVLRTSCVTQENDSRLKGDSSLTGGDCIANEKIKKRRETCESLQLRSRKEPWRDSCNSCRRHNVKRKASESSGFGKCKWIKY